MKTTQYIVFGALMALVMGIGSPAVAGGKHAGYKAEVEATKGVPAGAIEMGQHNNKYCREKMERTELDGPTVLPEAPRASTAPKNFRQ